MFCIYRYLCVCAVLHSVSIVMCVCVSGSTHKTMRVCLLLDRPLFMHVLLEYFRMLCFATYIALLLIVPRFILNLVTGSHGTILIHHSVKPTNYAYVVFYSFKNPRHLPPGHLPPPPQHLTSRQFPPPPDI